MTPGTERSDHVADPRWLDADQLATWRGFVALLERLPAALERQLQRDAHLSFVEYYVLAILSEEPTRSMRMTQLAAKVDAEQSRLSHLVKRLERRGLVRRDADLDDGRCTRAVLTDQGYELLAAAAPGHVAHVRALFVDALEPGELATWHGHAQKILARIDASRQEGDL